MNEFTEDECFNTLTFMHTSDDGREHYKRFQVSDVAHWKETLFEFLDFMGSVQGYDISQYVSVNLPDGYVQN